MPHTVVPVLSIAIVQGTLHARAHATGAPARDWRTPNRIATLARDARRQNCARLSIDLTPLTECPTALLAALVIVLGHARRDGIGLTITPGASVLAAARVARLAHLLPLEPGTSSTDEGP